MEPKELALRIAQIAKSKKAKKVVVLDMRAVSNFCDYFIISSGTSLRQTKAIAENIEKELSLYGLKPISDVPPNDESGWIVLDFLSVIAHIFYEPVREFYDLEHLWSDAKRIRISKTK